MSDSTSGRPAFIKSLGLWDVIFMNIVAVVGLRWIARGARAGPESVTLWVSRAWRSSCLSRLRWRSCRAAIPIRGRLRLGSQSLRPRHGLICGWCLWVNNLFYFPSVLLFGAANPAAMGGDRFPGPARFALVAVRRARRHLVLGRHQHRRAAARKWLHNAARRLVGSGGPLIGRRRGVLRFGSATTFSAARWSARDALDTIGLWSAMCFAFPGFEITSLSDRRSSTPSA